MKAFVSTAAIVMCLAVVAGKAVADDDEHSKVMGSVHIAEGEHAGDATTVNGSVVIGPNATVKNATTVNGSITMQEHSSAASLETVNGSIRLELGTRVAGKVELVNGKISLDKDADVSGSVTNVNGSIQLTGAHVSGGIQTSTGDIEVGANSRVEGGILVREDDSWIHFGSPRIPHVVIGPGAVVTGTLKFQREVKLYVSDHAVIGAVEGATANKFSGASPP